MDFETYATAGLDVESFVLPPITHNEAGNVRAAGFEFEYAGLSLERSAELVQQVFGGRHEVQSTFVHRVADTRFGDFSVEIDTSLLKDKKYESVLQAVGLDPEKLDRQWLEKTLLSVASTFVPIEIATPPIPITQLGPLDELRRLLHENQAKGTRASLLYAFGLHINLQAPSMRPADLLAFLQAFLLLYQWIAKRVDADIVRRITPFINSFPTAYSQLVLNEDYPATSERLINDYLQHNPTRNRPLDMLPLLACLDRNRVLAVSSDPQLVKPRPAFHYRMPNCLVDEPLWRVSREWNTWVAVERLAFEIGARGMGQGARTAMRTARR